MSDHTQLIGTGQSFETLATLLSETIIGSHKELFTIGDSVAQFQYVGHGGANPRISAEVATLAGAERIRDILALCGIDAKAVQDPGSSTARVRIFTANLKRDAAEVLDLPSRIGFHAAANPNGLADQLNKGLAGYLEDGEGFVFKDKPARLSLRTTSQERAETIRQTLVLSNASIPAAVLNVKPTEGDTTPLYSVGIDLQDIISGPIEGRRIKNWPHVPDIQKLLCVLDHDCKARMAEVAAVLAVHKLQIHRTGRIVTLDNKSAQLNPAALQQLIDADLPLTQVGAQGQGGGHTKFISPRGGDMTVFAHGNDGVDFDYTQLFKNRKTPVNVSSGSLPFPPDGVRAGAVVAARLES